MAVTGSPFAGIHIEFSDQPCEEETKQIHEGIKAFNNEISIHHREARKPGSATPLNLFVRDSEGVLIGGLTATTYWGWLDIDDLWLDESLRKQGIGTVLMQRAEEEGIRRRCTQAQLSTFSFQAKDFYEKLGYRVVGALDDYPPGSSLYWLRKDFSKADGDANEAAAP